MNLKSIKIGALETPNNVFLAPLAGYTNAVFRELCFSLGAGLTFTEMVSAKGLCYGSKKTEELLFTTPDYGGIKACQLFGNDPEIISRAANGEQLKDFGLIDLNFGCPMPKIYNNGEGSALLNNLPLAEKIIRACKTSGKAVSVKFRIGLSEDKIISSEFARMCECAGADMITVHGRVRDKIYSGAVNYKAVEAAKRAVKIPVIANGGIFCKADADSLMDKTGADGVCIARGAMYSPEIFSEITGRAVPDKKEYILKQIDDTKKYYGERFACVYMRKMCAFYIKGLPNAAAMRTKLFCVQSTEHLKDVVVSIF